MLQKPFSACVLKKFILCETTLSKINSFLFFTSFWHKSFKLDNIFLNTFQHSNLIIWAYLNMGITT